MKNTHILIVQLIIAMVTIALFFVFTADLGSRVSVIEKRLDEDFIELGECPDRSTFGVADMAKMQSRVITVCNGI